MEKKTMTVRAVADLLDNATVEGDDSALVESLAPVESAEPGELTFAIDEKRSAMLAETRAAAAIVGDMPQSAPIPLIRVGDVPAAVARVLQHWGRDEPLPPPGRHPSAVVAEDADLADDVAVGPNVVIGARAKIGAVSVLCANVAIGEDVTIGRGCVLAEGVVVRFECQLGDRVRIGPNSVVGYDGFGYYTAEGVHHRVPHIGNVVLEDDVELGACTCVDRAKFGTTRIGTGTKVDNLVQIAHNVQTGRGCLLAAFVGVAGSARLGNYVVLGGHVGVKDNITLGDGVLTAAYSAIAQDVSPGQAIGGIPARPVGMMRRIFLSTPKLPELLRRVKSLEKRLIALESTEDH